VFGVVCLEFLGRPVNGAVDVAAIREDLDAGDGLLYRYTREDGLPGKEGAFAERPPPVIAPARPRAPSC